MMLRIATKAEKTCLIRLISVFFSLNVSNPLGSHTGPTVGTLQLNGSIRGSGYVSELNWVQQTYTNNEIVTRLSERCIIQRT